MQEVKSVLTNDELQEATENNLSNKQPLKNEGVYFF